MKLHVTKATDTNKISWQIGTLSIGVDASLYVQLHDILASLPSTEGISLSYTYQPFSAQGVSQGNAKGGNSLNIASENQVCRSFCIVYEEHHLLIDFNTGLGIASSWTDPTLSDTAISQVSQFIAKVSSAAAAKGKFLDFLFMNDANSLQNPLNSYGAAIVHHLESTSLKFDPKGTFQKLQNCEFLLSKK